MPDEVPLFLSIVYLSFCPLMCEVDHTQQTLGSGPGPLGSNGVFGGDEMEDDLSLFLASVPFAGNNLSAAVSGAWNVLAGPQGNRITV